MQEEVNGEEEKAKSKAVTHNFCSRLTEKAKANYLARQNQYKAIYRQREAEGTGPALCGCQIEDNPEHKNEDIDERHIHTLFVQVTCPPTDLREQSTAAAAAACEVTCAKEDEVSSIFFSGNGGQILLKDFRPKHFSFSKWVSKYGNPFVTAQGTPIDKAAFNAAMVTCCQKDLVYYHCKLMEQGSEPGILEAYLTEDEGPQQEEQNAQGIDLAAAGGTECSGQSTQFTPIQFPNALWPTRDGGGWECPEGFLTPRSFHIAPLPLPLRTFTRGPSWSPSPFPVSPERNALTPLLDYSTPEEVLNYSMLEEKLKDRGGGGKGCLSSTLQAYRGSLQYDQQFNLLLYKRTAPTNLDIYNHNAGKQWLTVEILQSRRRWQRVSRRERMG
ncbi:hypothetical protein C8F04DRAFT_1192396 [Mycena alexandri]|uniref:Uncharacterized protein n=1 Tax=Mycena alexandri TaxID=1745969 RepID=A0AAD6SB39_9AGAR|nr:hypothetical protein C8F04DRAFT_1192396 [Mycena alexandri]